MTVLALVCAGLAGWLWVPPPERVRHRLSPVAEPVPWSARRGLRLAVSIVCSLLAVALVGSIAGPAAASVAFAALIGVAVAGRLIALGRRTRAEHVTREEVADACSVIANQVRVGRIPAEALVVAAEDAHVLAVPSRVQRNGGDVVSALLDQAEQPGCRGLADLAHAWQVGTRTGAPMADLLDQVAKALRADQSIERTVAAELAGPRATGRVMAVLPLCGIGLGYLLGGDPLGFLVGAPVGWGCLIGGASLAACGVLWIEWLARQVGEAGVTLDDVISAAAAVSPWAVVAAVLAALTVLLLWTPPIDPRVAGPSRRSLPRWLRGRDDAAPPGRRLLYGAVLGMAAAALAVRGGLGAALALGIAVAVAAGTAIALGLLEPGKTRARRQRRIADAPRALDLLASCLAAGLPVRAALRAVVDVVDGPLGEDLAQVLRLTDLGHDDVSAWRTLARHDQLGPAALDLARSVETGSLLVESLLVHAEVAREDRRGQVEAAARRVGVRSVMPLMLCFIPAFLLIGIVPTVASAILNALHF